MVTVWRSCVQVESKSCFNIHLPFYLAPPDAIIVKLPLQL
jgi:hypothetical protein